MADLRIEIKVSLGLIQFKKTNTFILSTAKGITRKTDALHSTGGTRYVSCKVVLYKTFDVYATYM